MIRLDNISKQNGHQIVFIEAAGALLKLSLIHISEPTRPY